MTTKEAFAQLISKRGWYKDLGIGPMTANTVAKRFKDGESVTNDKLEAILEKAGYRVVVEKQWAEPGVPTIKEVDDLRKSGEPA